MKHFFFKNRNPRQAVYLTGKGVYVQFEAINLDIGVIAVRMTDVAEELRSASRRNVSGVEEITEEEYTWLKKKQVDITRLQEPWREEFNPKRQQNPTNRPIKQVASAEERRELQERQKSHATVTEKLRVKLEQSQLPDKFKPNVAKKVK